MFSEMFRKQVQIQPQAHKTLDFHNNGFQFI